MVDLVKEINRLQNNNSMGYEKYESSVLQRGDDGTTPEVENLRRQEQKKQIEELKKRLAEIRGSASDADDTDEIARILEEEARNLREKAKEA
ncbi:MAG: hypothetical protein IPJ67_04230 [Candidatus Moraniibacteriota bacterium]|nr:MAG: hypothetical protein IPJ67_04230 [Candidatus Moranbacteria bacterium]